VNNDAFLLFSGDGVLGARPVSCPPVIVRYASDESEDDSDGDTPPKRRRRVHHAPFRYAACGRITGAHVDSESISAYLAVSC
jgi:hypothetical protein